MRSRFADRRLVPPRLQIPQNASAEVKAFCKSMFEAHTKLVEQFNKHDDELRQLRQGELEWVPVEEQPFTTDVMGSAYVDLATEFQAKHFVVTWLAAADRSEVSFVWAATARRTATGLRVLFVGLNASTRYLFSAVYA